MSDTIVTDDYGTIPRRLWQNFKKWNLSPADFDMLEDAYCQSGQPVDFEQMERFIRANLGGGTYQAPWPLRPEEVLSA